MNSGLKLTTYFIGLSLLWSSLSHARNQMEAAHNPAITKNETLKPSLDTAQDPFAIFQTKLLPFMQKNCSECHGDNAYYPVGPKHSVSNAQNAFTVFNTLLDLNDFKKSTEALNPKDVKFASKFINFANNKHYCRDHNHNCANQDEVDQGITSLFKSYVEAVTAYNEAKAKRNEQPTQNSKAIGSKSSQGKPSPFKVKPIEPTTHREPIQVDNVALTMTTKVRVYRPDFIKVVHIYLSTAEKIDLTFDGIEIKINGHLPTKNTGFETMSRDLSFDGLGRMTTKLTLTREAILKAKPGDEITVKLLGLRPKDLGPQVKACKDETYALNSLELVKPYLPQISSMVYGHEGYQYLSRNQKEICEQILLRINPNTPALSVLVQQLPKDLQAQALQNVQKLLTPDDMAAPKLDEVLMTASYGNSFCYALANDVYCIGNSYDYSQLRHIPVPQGVKRLSLGYYSLGIEDMNNNWHFIDNTNTLPRIIRNQNSYNFGEELLDLKVYRELVCYLNSEHNLYCGGRSLRDIINERNNDGFVKMTDIKIKEFSMTTYIVTAIGLDGKIYYWIAPSYYTDLKDSSKLLDSNSNLYELVFDKEVKKINSYESMIVITTTDDKIHVFSDAIPDYIGELEFGENLAQGQDISEGLKFKELGILRRAICGLTAEKELYCRGFLPSGLKYESNIDRARQFTKVSNTPEKIKQVMFGKESICFLLESNEITCAGGVTVTRSDNTDNQGRLIYTGNEKESIYQAPHVIAPIPN